MPGWTHTHWPQTWVWIPAASLTILANCWAGGGQRLVYAGKNWWQDEKGVTEDEMVGWLASSTQWIWVWTNSGRCWRTGKPGKLQSMGSQSQTRLRDWTTTGSRTGCGALWLTFLSVSRPGRWLMPPNNYCWGVTEHWVWPSGNYAGELGFYFYFASKFLVDLQQLP